MLKGKQFYFKSSDKTPKNATGVVRKSADKRGLV